MSVEREAAINAADGHPPVTGLATAQQDLAVAFSGVIARRPIDQLKANPRNARTHTKKHFGARAQPTRRRADSWQKQFPPERK